MERTCSQQSYRLDLECEARTAVICFANPISNLKQSPGLFKPINHCAEMLTRIKRSRMELFVLLCKSSESDEEASPSQLVSELTHLATTNPIRFV